MLKRTSVPILAFPLFLNLLSRLNVECNALLVRNGPRLVYGAPTLQGLDWNVFR